jgi:sugar lactone lactonase YvrE
MAGAAAGAPPVATPLDAYTNALRSPVRMALNPAGHVFVTEPEAGKVVELSSAGAVLSQRSGLGRPLSIAVTSTRIYVGDEATGSVGVYDTSWNLLGKLGAGNGEFQLPGYIALSPGGGTPRVHVADSRAHQVKVYTNLTRVATLGGPGTTDGKFDFPTGVWVATNGNVFVVDQNNDRVQVFNAAGSYLSQFPLGTPLDFDAKSGRSQGITGDASGRLYIADSFQGEIKSFDTAGNFLALLAGFGRGLGQLRTPTDVAITADSRLLVVSPNNRRVEDFGLDYFLGVSVVPPAPVVGVGTNVSLVVTLTHSGPFTYQWFKGATPLANGPGVSGATSLTLTLSGVTEGSSGTYTLVITGPTGPASSVSAVLTVGAQPGAPQFTAIATQPGSQVKVVFTADAGYTYLLEASSNLVGWAGLTNIQSVTGTIQYVDPSSATKPLRYYRARWVP